MRFYTRLTQLVTFRSTWRSPSRTCMDETLHILPRQSGPRIRIEWINGPKCVMNQPTGVLSGRFVYFILALSLARSRRYCRQWLIGIHADDLSFRAARATRGLEITAVLGLCAGIARSAKCLSHCHRFPRTILHNNGVQVERSCSIANYSAVAMEGS